MLKKALALFFILPSIAITTPVVEGTYISGTNKRVHLSSFGNPPDK